PLPPPRRSPLFPYTTLFRSAAGPLRRAAPPGRGEAHHLEPRPGRRAARAPGVGERGVLRRRLAEPVEEGAREGGAAPGLLVLERSEEHTSELQSRFDLVCRL